MPVTVVIPMAGLGSRFADHYEVPKPFIRFNDAMMIEHVMRGLAPAADRFVLVVREEFRNKYSGELDIISGQFSVSFASVDRPTMGASCTALAARRHLDAEQPVLFADSDNIFEQADILEFIDDARSRELDGSLLTFPSTEDCYSYAGLGDDGEVLETREKEVISSHAIAGCYLFARAEDFVDAAVEMLIYGDMQKGEFYMSQVYNQAIAKNKRIGIFEIPLERFNCVGTPEQLEAYLNG